MASRRVPTSIHTKGATPVNTKPRLAAAGLAIIAVLAIDLICVKAAQGKAIAHIPETRLQHKARTASISSRWQPILDAYTGSSYGISLVNQLWPRAPKGKRRNIILGAAVHHHVPFRLLLGIWGAESSYGQAASHFGLTGYFPGRGTSGNFTRDAHMAADLLDRLYRNRYHRRSL